MSRPLPSSQPDESPDVPGFRTWRGIYILVLVAFVVTVVLLAGFAEMFS